MILDDLFVYMRNNATLTTLVGSNVFDTQAPNSPDVKMPWLIIEITSGDGYGVSSQKKDNISFGRITVDVGPSQRVLGARIAAAAVSILDGYRGQLGNSADVIISCGEVRDWPGMGGCYRYQFDATIRYLSNYSLQYHGA